MRRRHRSSWRERRCRTRGIGWIQTNRRGVEASQGFARVAIFIVDLDKLNLRELFEILRERLRDSVKCAVRLAVACEINVCNTICKDKFAVTRKTVEHKPKPLIPFNIARTLEVFI